MKLAITRQVSSQMNDCELTHLNRQPIDIQLAAEQHKAYESLLMDAGYIVNTLPEEPGLPDSVFVEDTALLFDEIAVITRPGAAPRRAETDSVATALATHKALAYIESPATLDGGDVLTLCKYVYVGLSCRSNQAAVDQLTAILSPFGYTVQGVEVSGCLHLKSAVTQVGENTLLANPAWVDTAYFPDYEVIHVHRDEPGGANALWLGKGVVYPAQFPLTAACLESENIRVFSLDISEILKAEGAVTCCSLLFNKT